MHLGFHQLELGPADAWLKGLWNSISMRACLLKTDREEALGKYFLRFELEKQLICLIYEDNIIKNIRLILEYRIHH